MKLNLGSAGYILDEWHRRGFLNVDITPYPGVDIVADLQEQPWPWADGSIEELYCGHLLEHIRPNRHSWFLGEAKRVLEPGGLLTVVVPDLAEIADGYLHGRYSPERAAELLFGYDHPEASHPGAYAILHKWYFDQHSLRRVLETAGFIVGAFVNHTDARLVGNDVWQVGWEARSPAS